MDPIVIVIIAVVVVGAGLFLVLWQKKPDEPAGKQPPSEPAPSSSAKPGDSPSSERVPTSSPTSTPKSTPSPTSEPSATSAPADEVFEEPADDKTGPNPLILVTAVGRTDPGLKRKHNEDAYLVLEEHSLFVVADGMGRHAAGEVASRLAVDTVSKAYTSGDFGTFPQNPKIPRAANRLLSAFLLANASIFKESREVEAYAGMGTTMVALNFSVNRKLAVIVHAGDSRCYRIRKNEIKQLTQDHTLGAAGIVGPSAYILSRAVGIEEHLEPDVNLEQPDPEDLYLICSDGLSRMITNEAILECCTSSRNLDDVCKRLIDLANQGGGRDNVTVILVRVEQPPFGS
ncbi:MAG: protein phosphatase 2C domain-containing protein [Polyangiaceae bacterium]